MLVKQCHNQPKTNPKTNDVLYVNHKNAESLMVFLELSFY